MKNKEMRLINTYNSNFYIGNVRFVGKEGMIVNYADICPNKTYKIRNHTSLVWDVPKLPYLIMSMCTSSKKTYVYDHMKNESSFQNIKCVHPVRYMNSPIFVDRPSFSKFYDYGSDFDYTILSSPIFKNGCTYNHTVSHIMKGFARGMIGKTTLQACEIKNNCIDVTKYTPVNPLDFLRSSVDDFNYNEIEGFWDEIANVGIDDPLFIELCDHITYVNHDQFPYIRDCL